MNKTRKITILAVGIVLSIMIIASSSSVNAEWISPINTTNPDGDWYDEFKAYDGNTATYMRSYGIQYFHWSGYVYFELENPITSNMTQFYIQSDWGDLAYCNISISILSDSWTEICNFRIEHPENYGWNNITYSETPVSKLRFRLYNNHNGYMVYPLLNEIRIWDMEEGVVGWLKIDETGSWEICERTHWVTAYENYTGTAQWRIELTNFTGYSANFSMSYFTVIREWWGERASEQFWLTYNFTGSNNESITMEIRIGNAEYLWGLLKGIPQIMVTTNDTNEFASMIAGDTFNIYAWQDGSELCFRVLAYRDINANLLTIPINLCDINFDVGESWFENVTLTMTARHNGFGTFNLTLEDSIKQNEAWTPEYQIYDYPYYPTIFDLIFLAIRGAIPKWAIDVIDTLHGWSNQLFSFIPMITNMVAMVLPFLPYIIVFWLVDVSITAISTGNLQPFGVMIMTLYNFVTVVIHALVSIMQFLYDIITFWS